MEEMEEGDGQKMANGSGLDQLQIPYFLKVIIHTIKELGITMIVMGVLVGILAGWVPSPLLQQHERMIIAQQYTHKVLESNAQVLARQAILVDELIWVNRAACINSANNTHDKERCLKRRGND